MLLLFLFAAYGLMFYVVCAPVFWLIIQFVSDRHQRQHATRVLLGIGAGLMACIGISCLPEVLAQAWPVQPPQTSHTTYGDEQAARMTLEDMRRRYSTQALP